jgi:predicted transcriptional regulator
MLQLSTTRRVSMATLPIYLDVEDVAFGPVLIALRKMPGIIRIRLDDDDPKPGRQSGREPRAGGQISAQPAQRGANAEQIVALLMQNNGGPLQITEIMRAIGSTKSSAYTAMYTLKKKHVVQTPQPGQYELTDKAKRELLPNREAIKLLPKPREAAKAKTNGHKIDTARAGRAAPGTGQKLLLQALSGGALKREALIKQLGESGMSEKSVTGVMTRARSAKLIKSLGAGSWELTAKGTNQAADPATAAEA